MQVSKSKPYVDEDQRNIHVWAPHKFGKTYMLVAGCYSKQNAVTKNRFYSWLDIILGRYNDKQLVISKCSGETDPRTAWPNSWRSYQNNHLKREDRDHALELGHYFVLLKKTEMGQGQDCQLPSWDYDIATLFDARFADRALLFSPITATETALYPTPTRSDGFKHRVRERDRGCIVTSTVVPVASRGLNYTGFQAANLWPLSWWPKLERAQVKLVMNEKTRKKLQDWHKYTNSRSSIQGIDTPNNGILLSSTLHLSMDAWEWGIDRDDLAVRFEEHSAIFLPNTFTQIHPPFNMNMNPVIPDFDRDFRDAHFNLVLMHRVAGTGPIPGTSKI